MTYDYKCEAGHVVTVERRINDEEIKPVCADCGGAEMRRVYGSVAISFRGSGWGRG